MRAQHLYHYPQASHLKSVGERSRCHLVGDRESFLRAKVLHPRPVALGLRGVAKVVQTRFYTSPGVIATLQDPVVTVGQERLRFEGFSGCCSTYVRLDLNPEALEESEERSPGTTNVDFQAPLRAALAQVRDQSILELEVGASSVAVEVDTSSIVERKVDLPIRWIKGLGEVQSFLSRMEQRFEVGRVEAQRFLRALPRAARKPAYVQRLGTGLRWTPRAATGESGPPVLLAAPERLAVLEDLIRYAKRLLVFCEPGGASAWQIDLGFGRFTVAITKEPWRGFSGEGQLLRSLAQSNPETLAARIIGSLAWNDRIDLDALASATDANRGEIQDALAWLAIRGQVGFDLDGGWFHRRLPFDLEHATALHPRLTKAEKLVAEGRVTVEEVGVSETQVVRVQSSDVLHTVTLCEASSTCTCPWMSRHQGERGPCAHILAALMSLKSHEPS